MGKGKMDGYYLIYKPNTQMVAAGPSRVRNRSKGQSFSVVARVRDGYAVLVC
jgi:hypothetical protein